MSNLLSMNNDHPQEFGDRIRGLLEQRHISQTDLARRTGIDRPDLNRLINNKRPPRADELSWLAEALEVSLEDLLKDVKLPEQVRKSIAEIEALMTRAMGAEQKCAEVEAKLSSLETAIEHERAEKRRERVETEEKHRMEMAQLRNQMLSHVEQEVNGAYEREMAQFAKVQELDDEVQKLRATVAQLEGSLSATNQQALVLRSQVAQQSSATAAVSILTGLTGLALGVALNSRKH